MSKKSRNHTSSICIFCLVWSANFAFFLKKNKVPLEKPLIQAVVCFSWQRHSEPLLFCSVKYFFFSPYWLTLNYSCFVKAWEHKILYSTTCALNRNSFHYPLTEALNKLAEMLWESQVESLLGSSFNRQETVFHRSFIIINAMTI